jgi:hypothetical protein
VVVDVEDSRARRIEEHAEAIQSNATGWQSGRRLGNGTTTDGRLRDLTSTAGPWESMDPVAFTALTSAHAETLAGVVVEKFAAFVQSVAAPEQYDSVQPDG